MLCQATKAMSALQMCSAPGCNEKNETYETHETGEDWPFHLRSISRLHATIRYQKGQVLRNFAQTCPGCPTVQPSSAMFNTSIWRTQAASSSKIITPNSVRNLVVESLTREILLMPYPCLAKVKFVADSRRYRFKKQVYIYGRLNHGCSLTVFHNVSHACILSSRYSCCHEEAAPTGPWQCNFNSSWAKTSEIGSSSWTLLDQFDQRIGRTP